MSNLNELKGKKVELFEMVKAMLDENGYDNNCLVECEEQIHNGDWEELLGFIELVSMSEKEYDEVKGFVRKYFNYRG